MTNTRRPISGILTNADIEEFRDIPTDHGWVAHQAFVSLIVAITIL